MLLLTSETAIVAAVNNTVNVIAMEITSSSKVNAFTGKQADLILARRVNVRIRGLVFIFMLSKSIELTACGINISGVAIAANSNRSRKIINPYAAQQPASCSINLDIIGIAIFVRII